MLAGFSFRFLVVIPLKTITIFEFSMGLAHKFPLLSCQDKALRLEQLLEAATAREAGR